MLTNARSSCWVLVAYNSSSSLSSSSQNKKQDSSETASPKPFQTIPGPKPAPFIGNLWRYLPFIGTGQIALDKRLGCLRSDGEPSEEAQQLITAAADTHHAVMITENRLPIWKYSTTLSYSYRTLVNAQDTMARIVLKHLDQALTVSSNTEPECVNASVLHQFASTPDLSKADIFTMILDMFLAGIDTTAYSTAFALYHLAKNMDKQMLLRKELVSLLPSKDTPLTLPIIQEAHFLRACVKESLRLHPIAIGVGRVVPEDIVLSGYKVPKQGNPWSVIGCVLYSSADNHVLSLEHVHTLGACTQQTIVITQNQVACRSAHFSQPDRFLPERWIRGQELEEKTHPFLFLPFGYGPRSCVGKRFALLEMHLALAKIFRQFQVNYDGTMDCVTRLINVPDKPLKLKLTNLEY